MTDRIVQYLSRTALLLALLAGAYLATTEGGPTAASGINDKITHLAGFYMLAWLADFSSPRSRCGVYKMLPLVGYGLLIEIIQFYLPYRSFSLLDMLVDGAGLLLYGLTLLLWRRSPFNSWRLAFARK
jgi:VanZ family protein